MNAELTKQEAYEYLLQDEGSVPGSRYGYNTRSCMPLAYAVYVIVSSETGEDRGIESLDHAMGLVVNNSDGPEYLIRNYGKEYGFNPEDYLDD